MLSQTSTPKWKLRHKPASSRTCRHRRTFDSYRCADGTHFILAFYPRDQRAYIQIDGHAVTLKKSLSLSGRRYWGGGVSLTMTATGALIRHLRRPVTACEIS
jgi:membrane-bound inhibitor of C-type lysozyme